MDTHGHLLRRRLPALVRNRQKQLIRYIYFCPTDCCLDVDSGMGFVVEHRRQVVVHGIRFPGLG